jgi:hypothetical protein
VLHTKDALDDLVLHSQNNPLTVHFAKRRAVADSLGAYSFKSDFAAIGAGADSLLGACEVGAC